MIAYTHVDIEVYKEPSFISDLNPIVFVLGIDDKITTELPLVDPEQNLAELKVLMTAGCNEIVSFDEQTSTIRV